MGITILHMKSPLDLRETSARVFATLGIQEYERHESDNYAQGLYFMGRTGDIRIKMTLEDDAAYDDYQYWIVVNTPSAEASPSAETVNWIAKAILENGFEVCREIDSAAAGSRRELYFLRPGGRLETKLEDKPKR